MEPSSLDRNTPDWTCSVCGRTRQCPFAAPRVGQARAECCRSCGETLADAPRGSARALNAAIAIDLI